MIQKFLSLVKFSHTIFALPFALIGYTYGITQPGAYFTWLSLVFVLLCMVFARNAAMAFNRWADQRIDAANPRTAVREIPAGTVSSRSAIWFVVLNCVGFLVCTYFISPLCLALAPLFLLVILGYSYTKRFTSLSHFVLGLGLALAPFGAYLTIQPEWSNTMLLVSLIVFTWVSGFDIIYSCQDEDFDKQNKLHSIPSLLGRKNALHLSTVLHGITAVLLVVLGWQNDYGLFYWLGAAIFIALLLYQHLLVKPTDLSRVNLAFFTTNGIASVVFALFYIVEMVM